MATTIYFAPTYFAPTFFSPYAPTQPLPTPSGSAPPGDRDAYAAILAALDATGAFESVLFASPLERLTLGAAATPLASVVPEGWEEFDEVDPTAILRRVSFRLELLVSDDDSFARFELLDALESAARGAIEGSGLGDVCLPALTWLRRSRYDPRSLPPEQASRLDGEFTYIIGSI
jgi:hypothetical protein